MASSAKTKPAKAKTAGRKRKTKQDEKVSAEALLGRLDEVVRELEAGDLPLEQSLARFEEGVKLVREGEQLLASVEQRIEILLGDDRVEEFANEQSYADGDHEP